MNYKIVKSMNKLGNNFSTLEDYQGFINYNLDNYIVKHYPNQIHEMIKYITTGGKRLRSVMCLIFGNIELSHNKHEIVIDTAISIELIHCLSLVIDDSPSMDNDDIRRGQETFHKKFGINRTNLIVYYLINKISTLFSKYNLTLREIKLLKVTQSSLNKLIEGQCLDININKNQVISHKNHQLDNNKYLDTKYFLKEYHIIIDLIPNELNNTKLCDLINNIKLNFLKTSSLFCLSLLLSSSIINENMDDKIIDDLTVWANLFGIAFQYSDDILDIKQDTDNNNPNITFVIGKTLTIKFVYNILSYLRTRLPEILKILQIYSDDKINIMNNILSKIKSRCETKKCLYV